MKLSYGGQCGRNGFMAYVGSGNRPVLSASHAGYIPRTSCWFSIFTRFASAHPMRVASQPDCSASRLSATLPQRIPCGLHPCASAWCCPIPQALPQRIPCGLHRVSIAVCCSLAVLCLSASHAGCILFVAAACLVPYIPLPQRIPCGLHQNRWKAWSVNWNFASAHPMRVASAKMHKIHSMDL